MSEDKKVENKKIVFKKLPMTDERYEVYNLETWEEIEDYLTNLIKDIDFNQLNDIVRFVLTDKVMTIRDLVKKKVSIFMTMALNKILEIKDILKSKDNFKVDDALLFAGSGNQIFYFTELSKYLTDREYWKSLGSCYTLQDYNEINYNLLKSLFLANKPEKEYLMDEDERIFFNNLPQQLTIFRACSKKEIKNKKYGLSWTLSKKVADFFKERKVRHEGFSEIVSIVIDKKDAIAYLNGRNEEEIIYLGN